MKRAGLIALLLAIVTSGALTVRSFWKPHMTVSQQEYRKGELDANGRLIILAGARGVRKSLDHDYAMRVFYDDDVDLLEGSLATTDRYTIELYSQPGRKIWSARTVAGFRENLQAIPNGVTLYLYNGGCAIPPFQNQAVLGQIQEACASRELKVLDSEFTICTCPAW